MVMAGPVAHTIRTLHYDIEDAGSFSVEQSWPGAFTALPFVNGSLQITTTRGKIDPGYAVQYQHGRPELVAGKPGWTMSFDIALAPTGTAANAGTTAVANSVQLLLAEVFGGAATLASGSTAAAGWTAVTGDVADGTKWTAGMSIGWVNASGVLEMREIKTVSTNTITLKLAFSGSPALNDVMYNASCIYLANDATSSLQFVLQGQEPEDRWLFKGGQGTVGITLPTDGTTFPTLSFSFAGIEWFQADGSATTMNLVGSDIAAVTYESTHVPILAMPGDLRVAVNGTTTLAGTQVHAQALEVAVPGSAKAPLTSPAGTYGVLRWRMPRLATHSATCGFTTYFEDDTWWDADAAKTDYAFFYQLGTAAGSSILISVPTCQILDAPQRVDAGNDLAGSKIMLGGRNDSDVTSTGTNDPQANAPIRIHFG